MAQTITITFINTSGVSDSNVFILLVGGSSADGKLVNGVPKSLDKVTDAQFTLAANSGLGRIFISFDKPVTVGEPFNSGTRFEWVELTYVPPGISQCNLTAVDQFGIPLALEAIGADSGTKCWVKNANAIIAGLKTLAPASIFPQTGTFARIVAPPHASSSVFSNPKWSDYLASLSGATVRIKDNFSKAGELPIFIDYQGVFGTDGTITLSGTMTQGGNPLSTNFDVKIFGPIPPFPPPQDIPQISFADQIYGANGPYFRSDNPSTYHTAGENNEYSVVYRDLISALQNGFLGGKFGNDSDGWVGKPSFAAARTTNDGFYNQYAAEIEAFSGGDIYGYAFSDNTAHPLLTITNSTALKISILSDTEVFGASKQLTKKVMVEPS